MNYNNRERQESPVDNGQAALDIAKRVFNAPINLTVGAIKIAAGIAILIPSGIIAFTGFPLATWGVLAGGALVSNGVETISKI